MAGKRQLSSEGKQKVSNGVSKAKKEPKKKMDGEEIVGDDVDVVPAPSAPKPERKKAKRMATSSSAGTRGGDRVRKPPERFEATVAQKGKKKGARGGAGGSGGREQFPVQAIRGIKKTGNKYLYLVKWQGYAESTNNWEPEENVRNCTEHIQTFLDEIAAHGNALING